MNRFNMQSLRSLGLLLASLMLAACGGEPSALPAPAGAAAGQNTFLYLYTDN